MEKEGIVSVWIGRASSEEAFWNALDVSFSDDGDFLGSDFSRALGIGYYEDSTREAAFLQEPISDIEGFMAGISYEEILLPKLKAAGAVVSPGDNCFVLLYNIQFEGPAKRGVSHRLDGLDLRFLGSFRYMT